ncbi:MULTISPECIES: adenylyltransferase/cytidyltransferase family protein [Amycolatopsis]|uniref:Glycerol-3-phosphate cytidylyltransferase n=1 Tax=Amycolatopsis alba DSM 44262 TaxID=1125972 RepID=A0A229RCA9_AMYAL|nr:MULTISPECIES: adenylyltransferase/cytidyltransferase family protein [Amycolatopsis]AUI63580.1 glycerol-3-phosphate cytidylyltransferase [Amycolatopsis sp. BJA-103]OXM44215.1 glycerol-3-phosphate cytidylyltransferase [Amycolatopsis alba DSM 44262]PNE19424.1 glycerol-3-phosphate cytidylyltransferase [Amycolatopsis sp. BJA-103]
MTERPAKASIVSGYFNPLHQGHLDLFEDAQARSGYLIVIVNNDHQQVLKKGRVIQTEDIRARIVRALRIVDDVYVAVEQGPGINESFDLIRAAYPDTELEFCNGGDRRSVDELPADEIEAGARNNIALLYGIGGTDKADSSTRILSDMEA